MAKISHKLGKFLSDAEYRRHLIEDPIRNSLQSVRDSFGYAPYPKTITLFLTNQCNLRCRMCAQWGENGVNFDQPKLFMDTKDMRKLFDEVAFFRPTLVIMGGEPMLNKEWSNVIRMARDRNIPSSMITNGMFIDRNAETLVDSGLEDLCLSVDGPEEIHDHIRKSPGGFNKIMDGINAVNQVKKQKNRTNPRINIFFTITGLNYKHLVELADSLKGRGINHFQIQHLWFVRNETYQQHNTEFSQYFENQSECYTGFVYEPGPIEPDILMDQLNNLRNNQREFSVLINPAHPDSAIPDYYTNPNFERLALRDCEAIWSSITIGPQGEISPCLDYFCGNIRTDKLLDVWNNSKMRYFRRVRKKHGPFPLCHRCCA